MSKIKRYIDLKGHLIDDAQEKVEKLIIEIGARFASDFATIVGRGVFDVNVILEVLEQLGYEQALLDAIRLESPAIQQLLEYSKAFSEAQGLTFALTAQNELQFAAYMDAVEKKILTAFRDEIAADFVKFGIESRLSARPVDQIINTVKERFAEIGRRAAAEVGTSIKVFDRAVMDAVYKQNGVERFVYFPPTLIPTSRESCRKAVNDPRQKTGWTREDIEKEPDLDFVLGGYPYYNCRHEWIAFNGD
jgi:hypothetical protein